MTIPPIVSLERFRKQLNAALAEGGGVVGTTSISPSGDTSGATDTAAIQAAITSGDNVQLSAGIFYTNATLSAITYASCGQTISGSGSYYTTGSTSFSTTPPANTTVIRPTAAVTTAILVDGTPVAGYQLSWVQGFGIENLCIDMTNMSDVSTNIGINQIQAWDARYSQVRIINEGTNKRGWLISAGAFTSTLMNCQSNWLDFVGTSDAYGVTTFTVINHDGNNVSMLYAGTTQFIGGAYQGSGTRFKLRHSFAVTIETDIEGTGTAYDIDSTNNSVWCRNELQGFSGTYLTGTPGYGCIFWDDQVASRNYPFSLGTDHIQLSGGGAAISSTFSSGSAAATSDLRVGRTGLDLLLAVSGGANSYITGDAAGDVILGSWGASTKTYLVAAQTKVLTLTATGAQVAGTFSAGSYGTVSATTLNVSGVATISGNLASVAYSSRPAVDGQQFTLSNAANTAWLIGSSNATAGLSGMGVGNGANWTGYSDNFVTLTYNFDAATGNASFAGLVSVGTPLADGVRLQVNNTGATGIFSVTSNATPANCTVDTTGKYRVAGTQVIGARQTGWTAPTGTLSRATFDQSTVTLPELAKRLAALITDLTTHGLIGT